MFRAGVLSALCACSPVAYEFSLKKWILGGDIPWNQAFCFRWSWEISFRAFPEPLSGACTSCWLAWISFWFATWNSYLHNALNYISRCIDVVWKLVINWRSWEWGVLLLKALLILSTVFYSGDFQTDECTSCSACHFKNNEDPSQNLKTLPTEHKL